MQEAPWKKSKINCLAPLSGHGGSESTEYERVDLLIDSGASVCALPRNLAKHHPLVQSTGIAEYRAANGAAVKNEGDKIVTSTLNNGTRQTMRFTVMDVHRPIASVSRIVRSGHRVVFDDGYSYIQNKKTGDTRQIAGEKVLKETCEGNRKHYQTKLQT